MPGIIISAVAACCLVPQDQWLLCQAPSPTRGVSVVSVVRLEGVIFFCRHRIKKQAGGFGGFDGFDGSF
jgi:hypothetical protein